MADHVRFSLMWVNDATHQRPMSSCRMTLRDAGGDAIGQSHGGLTCQELYLDQVIVELRPGTSIDPSEFQANDDANTDWMGPTTELYVRTSPGRRSVCYALTSADPMVPTSDGGTVARPHASLVYTTALALVDPVGRQNQRIYRPLRDLPVATRLSNISELTVDLLWPLLQSRNSPSPRTWFLPNYRIERVICDFTARV